MPSLDSPFAHSSDHRLESTIKNLKEEIEERKIEKEKLARRYDENIVMLLEEIDELKVKNRVLEETMKIQEEVADNLKSKLIQAEDKIHKLKRAFVLVDNCNQEEDEPENTPKDDKQDSEAQIKKEEPVDVDEKVSESNQSRDEVTQKKKNSHDSFYNMALLLIHLIVFFFHCKIAF